MYFSISARVQEGFIVNLRLNFRSYQTLIIQYLKMVGDYKSEGQQLMQTLLHAPRHRRAADTETGRFVHTGNDTTINLIPVFTAVIIGIAGTDVISKDIISCYQTLISAFAVLLTGALGGASGALPFTAAAKAGVEPAPAQPPAPGEMAKCFFFCNHLLTIYLFTRSSDSPWVLPVPDCRPGPRPVLLPASTASAVSGSSGPRLGHK